ncbi:PREDICTED: probable bifunctional TENA-E protein [Ipomoea nil]|uniref:probable bifunctional TENA-E protein n=1 Tax=Ipomoea nil TaxID=35883 RepID=UPI000901F2B0|nr:PREDICTED: probable bifunctional TENA-E protein [Ipomoea nil]
MERKVENVAESKKGMGMTETWMRKHDLLLIAATRNPFTQAIRDATLPLSSFNNWLGQEYWLAKRAFVPFLSTLLQKARHESNDIVQVIQTGIGLQNDKISWLEREAEKLHVSLDSVVPYQPTIDYSKLLESLTDDDYTAALSILWATQTVYHRTFAHCLSEGSRTPEEMKEACRKWGGDAQGDYCLSLQRTADGALEKAPRDVIVKAEVTLLEFLEISVQFWNNVVNKCMQPNAF